MFLQLQSFAQTYMRKTDTIPQIKMLISAYATASSK